LYDLYVYIYIFFSQVRATQRHGGADRRTRGHIRRFVDQAAVALRPGVRCGCDDLRGRQRHHTGVEFQVYKIM